MDFIKEVTIFFPSEYEGRENKWIDREVYFAQFLKQTDSRLLRKLIYKIAESEFLPSTSIIAVGSSAFPKSFWEERKKLKDKYPGKEVDTKYRDVDLIVAPTEEMDLEELSLGLRKTIISMGCKFKLSQNTGMGTEYIEAVTTKTRAESELVKTVCRIQHYDNGRRSIQTWLPNGRTVDIILGREGLVKNAEDVIYSENKDRRPSVLAYHDGVS